MPMQPAVLGTARLNNFRLGYLSAALAPIRATRVSILIAGVQARQRVRLAGLTIRDLLNDAPNTCSLTVDGTAPSPGQDLRVSINADTPRLLFSGTLQTVDISYEGRPSQVVWACTAIDDTARLNRLRPFGTFVNVSATTVAQTIIASFAPGFSSAHVQAGLPSVSIIFDGSESFSTCLARLKALIGGYCYIDDLDVHLFQTEGGLSVAPTVVAAAGAGLGVGTYLYAYTDVTALGESRPSPTATITSTAIAAPINAPRSGGTGTGGLTALATYSWAFTWVTAIGETTASPLYTHTLNAGETLQAVFNFPGNGAWDPVLANYPAPGGVLSLNLYRTAAGGAQLKFLVNLPLATTSYSDGVADGSLGANVPTVNTTAAGGVAVSAIAVGVAGVTARKLYRTVVGGSTLKLVTTLADNTTTTYTDTTVDGSLGATAPTSDTSGLTDAPSPIDATHPFLDDPAIRATSDDSQIRTRVYGKGHGEAVPVDVAAGETIVPVADAVMFGTVTAGGRAIAGTTPDGAQSQRLTYTGVQRGGAGSLVGPGAAPGIAPTLALNVGSTLGVGVYQYAYTDVTAAGQSLPSPLGAITTGILVPPSTAPTVSDGGPGGAANYGNGILYEFAFTFVTATGETTLSPVGSLTFASGPLHNIQVSNIAVGPSGVTARQLYRRDFGIWHIVNTGASLADNTTTTFFTHGLESISGAAPGSNTATGFNAVEISAIAVGPASTTARKLYRTVAGGSSLKLLTTIADNTTTTFTDNTADGSLGATAPTSDTSGLAQPQGQILAGAVTLPLASVGALPAAGWAVLSGEQVIRYTGISGSTLTGIPASGPGALLTTVLYGSPVLPAPALTGVSGLTLALQKGAPVSIWVQRDDLSAQAGRIAIDLAQGRVSDGVVEYTITDDRRGEASLAALCDADLALFSTPIVTVPYATRDVKTKSGKPLSVTLASPAISQTLVIQDVTITEIDTAPGVAPRFTASASTVRLSLDDLLRRLAGGLGVA